tara:strand:+ start:72 stop:257 length:186 start_codon:yes stop_codon:yes gene_type:complete
MIKSYGAKTITLYRNDFEILSDGTDCFEDMLVGQLGFKKSEVADIYEVDIKIDSIEDISKY